VETLDELFGSRRAVSLNAPTIESTRHMLRGKHCDALRPGSVFINTARGTHMHDEEFVAELRKGRFVTCIDRCEVEPCSLDRLCQRVANVLVIPHIAGGVADNRLRIGSLLVEEVGRYVRNLTPLRGVTREALVRMA
jgi:phosphoglycerate dehydrogenase-like enzyme